MPRVEWVLTWEAVSSGASGAMAPVPEASSVLIPFTSMRNMRNLSESAALPQRVPPVSSPPPAGSPEALSPRGMGEALTIGEVVKVSKTWKLVISITFHIRTGVFVSGHPLKCRLCLGAAAPPQDCGYADTLCARVPHPPALEGSLHIIPEGFRSATSRGKTLETFDWLVTPLVAPSAAESVPAAPEGWTAYIARFSSVMFNTNFRRIPGFWLVCELLEDTPAPSPAVPPTGGESVTEADTAAEATAAAPAAPAATLRPTGVTFVGSQRLACVSRAPENIYRPQRAGRERRAAGEAAIGTPYAKPQDTPTGDAAAAAAASPQQPVVAPPAPPTEGAPEADDAAGDAVAVAEDDSGATVPVPGSSEAAVAAVLKPVPRVAAGAPRNLIVQRPAVAGNGSGSSGESSPSPGFLPSSVIPLPVPIDQPDVPEGSPVIRSEASSFHAPARAVGMRPGGEDTVMADAED